MNNPLDKLSDNPLVQQLQLLLVGYEYNFYNRKNQARSDDLLVRQKAGASLTEAAELLAGLAVDFQKQRVPTASREHPFPPPEVMAELNAIKSLRDDILQMEATIRGMSVPPDDRTWQRYRDEAELLTRLLDFDVGLITKAEAVYQAVKDLDARSWNQASAQDVSGLLRRLHELARERERFLTVPR